MSPISRPLALLAGALIGSAVAYVIVLLILLDRLNH